MEIVNLEDIDLTGFSIRTSNSKEMNPNTAKIGKLWQAFYEKAPGQGAMPAISYGVYSNYESDHNGEYDVTAAMNGDLLLDDCSQVTIPSGKYLKFKKEGSLPEAALHLWQEIWEYFSATPDFKRSFQFDFEEYTSMTDVAIYIGVKE